ncbi:hypothetical protein JG688_00009111 [Phytophthora aleatoria]|uniref:EGF-like domain-containing protein n=1 Tax=Phytophthora aleatoria TaxID=2496075 RepID=A0A8J5MG12_9STRA|nr:hypothetical protein JG688_00009111 [Phytophthora aleatoria]
MRYRFDLALWTLIALLAIVNAFGDEIPTGKAEVPTHSDNAIATIDKNTRSFVAATHGSAYSLTLTTFLTDAAHLHYAVLPSGQPALDAAGVKSAADQCRSDVQTVTVSKAQKVVSAVETLQPNTSYDVFFVAEVVASNGVFGPVQSVLLSSTHPEPPEIDIISVESANATADTVVINATLTTLGRAYFALIPSGEDVQLTSEDLVQNRTTVTSAKSQFLVHTLGVNGSYNFQEIVEALTPATLYDVFIITEASGNGEVRSEVIHHPRKVRTHALAPEVTKLVCFPLNASATALDISFKLDVEQEDIDRVKPETLSYFTYDLHYEVIALSDVQELRANTTYELFVVTETSRDGNSSGVLGELVTFNVTTHAIAPKIVLATVDPVDGSTDSVVITANLSHPGMLHYFLCDVDIADPAIISNSDEKRTPHELRGQVEVLEEHILMEIINGTNDTRPTDPLVFVHNTTVRGLKAGTTYHVSLTTETYGSEGVFGEFPPPVLVNTHLGPPVIIPEKLSVYPVDGSSSALAIDFELDRFGDVHYALFFRGLVPDRSHEFDGPLEKVESKLEDAGNESISIWPPPISTSDLKNLNGSMLKEAKLEELGVGVWVNDTISVSREDITRGRMTHKEIDKLPANALFDVCLVSETAASGGILGWPSDGSVTACHRVVTHADYTNQSKLLDEISVHPIGGRTDGIRINLKVSKLLKAPQTTDGEVTSAFKDASPGHGDGVVAAGMLSNITRENATALVIEQEMVGLEANHKYLLFFAYETSGSNGVFTWINPHKHRGNDSRTENDGIPVTTYEAAPRIPKAKATPTFGQTSRITVKFDVACDSSDHGVYGAIHEVKDVSTFANAPILLTHAAYPTPGTTESLTVGFRMDAPGIVYFSAVAVKPWSLTHHVAKGSDRFGNRLALQDRLVAQKSLDVDKESMELESDSGWREMILQVPQTGVNYTVHLVTETKDSGGIYGTVATHAGVRAHSEAPELVNVSVNPTDARVDALSVNVTLSDRGHVHYVAVPSGRGSEPPSSDQSTELSVRASGRVDVNETTGDQKTDFVIAGLTEGTSYDLYFRSETFESFGVFGLWTKEAVTARTHGLPADVLPEAVECKVTPSCEQRGREACSRKANMCGKCLEGYGVEGDEEIPEANESCVKLTPDIKVKRGPKIKINGVTRNPNLHMSETESETQSEEEHEQEPVHPVPTEQVTLDQQPVDLDAGQHDTMQAIEELEIIQESKQEEPIESTVPVTVDAMVQEPLQEPMQEVLGQPELVEQPVEHQVPVPVTPDQHVVGVGLAEITAEQEPTPDVPETSGCPLNAQPTASGLCECIPGYVVDEGGTSCVLSRMATVAEAASSGAFDILNAHHQVPSHSM